jgi:hypothetical protein
MVLFYQSLEKGDGNTVKWYFARYDKNLQQVWVKSVPVLSELTFTSTYHTRDTVCLAFQAKEATKNQEVNFQLLRITLLRGGLILNNGKSPENTDISFMNVSGNTAIFGLNREGSFAQMLFMDLPTGETKNLPLGEEVPTRLEYMETDQQTSMIRCIVRKQISKRYSELFLVNITSAGGIAGNIKISAYSEERVFTDCRIFRKDDSTLWLVGTYALSLASASTKKEEIPGSTGIFSTKIVNNQQREINFYNFLDLKNASGFIGEKDQLEMKKKAMKKSRQQAEPSLDFTLVMHDLMVNNNEVISILETFYPQFHTETFTDYDFYGRPFTNSYTVFDGYRFSNVILAAFDTNGKLIWDNAMTIRNMVTFIPEPQATVFPSGDDMVIAYSSDGKIASKIIRQSELREKTSYSAIELSDPNEKVLSETKSRMMQWYDRYFLCSGYQEIKNISYGEKEKKLVFYFNKILFEE